MFSRTTLVSAASSLALFCLVGADQAVAQSTAADPEQPAAQPAATGSLDDALAMSVESHPSIIAARVRARAAGVDLSAARWARLPSVTVEGHVLDKQGTLPVAQLVVDQPLFDGGRIGGMIGRARFARDAALAGYDETRQIVILAVIDAWLEEYRLRFRTELLADSARRHDDMVESMRRRVDHGISPLADLELARTRALQVEQQRLASAAQERTALRRLRELVGDPAYLPSPKIALPAAWPEFDDEAVIALAAQRDPRLRRIASEAAAAGAEARVARAQVWPQVSGQYTYNDVQGHRFGFVVKAQAEGGIGRIEAARAADLREQATAFQIAATRREFNETIAAEVQTYTASKARLVAGGEAANTAERVMESYMRQFASGRRGWLDVMNAVREASAADLDALDARVSALDALLHLNIRTGDGTVVAGQSTQ